MYVSSKRLKRNYRKLDCPTYNCRTSKNNAKTWNKNTFVLHYIRKFIDKNIQEHCKQGIFLDKDTREHSKQGVYMQL